MPRVFIGKLSWRAGLLAVFRLFSAVVLERGAMREILPGGLDFTELPSALASAGAELEATPHVIGAGVMRMGQPI